MLAESLWKSIFRLPGESFAAKGLLFMVMLSVPRNGATKSKEISQQLAVSELFQPLSVQFVQPTGEKPARRKACRLDQNQALWGISFGGKTNLSAWSVNGTISSFQ